MRQIKSKIFLFAVLASTPLMVNAQAETDMDIEGDAPKNVHVAFRDKAADQLLGGVSFVDMEELQQKDYTTGSLDDLNALVGGWTGSFLWGMDNNKDRLDTNENANLPLVLVDGVKRPSNNVLPSEIEQVTFLKGAQAVVLYGPKAALGVILITTKRGKVDGLKIEANVNTGFHVAKAFPEYVGSAEYMTLYNQACINDGRDPKFSQQDIYNYASGINPYRYPNVNYYSDDYIRKVYNRSEATVEIQGGAERARFYTNVSYYRHEDLLNFGQAKHNYTDRFSVRGNVDLKINKLISGYANASATFYNANKCKGNFWDKASSMRPNYPENAAPLIPIDMVDPNASKPLAILDKSINLLDGKYFPGGSILNKETEIATGYFGGKGKSISRQFQFDAGIIYDMNKFLKGLQFKTMFSIDYAANYDLSYNNTYAVFVPTWSNYNGKDVIVGLRQEGDEVHTGAQSMSNQVYRQTISWNGHFDYDHTFGKVHHVTGMLLANMFTTTQSARYHRYANANVGLQAGYDYKGLYYADFSVAGVHSARLPEGNRESLSPSVSLGWRLGKEKFMDGTIVDDLMLSVSASQLNEDMDIYNDKGDYYIYDAIWEQGGGSFMWSDASKVNYTYSTQGKNPVLDYVKRKEFSFNLRGSFWQNLITADFTFFTNKMDGYIIKNPSTFPSHLQGGLSSGSFKPAINHDANQRTGFDFSIKAKKQFGEVNAELGFVGTYLYTKRVKFDESKEWSYQKEEGRPLDAIWGYECLGFYTKDDFVTDDKGKLVLKEGLPEPSWGDVRPGDLKYADKTGPGTNGKTVIDKNDMVYLGKNGAYGAPFVFGMNLTLKWKNFTLFALGTGNVGAYGLKNSTYYYPTGESKYSVNARNCWTEATASTAKYPRLTSLSGANNTQASTFWMYKTDRFDLRKVQLTYDFPSEIIAGKVVKALKVYISGNDLLTISKERKLMETSVGWAPQTRFYNLGAKVTF